MQQFVVDAKMVSLGIGGMAELEAKVRARAGTPGSIIDGVATAVTVAECSFSRLTTSKVRTYRLGQSE